MKVAASRLGVTIAEFTRQVIQARLQKAAKLADPFAWMDGLAETNETDLADRIDEILYRDARGRPGFGTLR
jgi:hypothetical protein